MTIELGVEGEKGRERGGRGEPLWEVGKGKGRSGRLGD